MSSVQQRIGVFVPYHTKLDKYLPAVEECFSVWDDFMAVDCDYKQRTEHDCRNAGLRSMGGCDYVFCVDADELITQADQMKLIDIMYNGGYDHALCRVIDYCPDMRSCYAIREHKPIVVAKPGIIEFWQGRCYRGGNKPYVTDDIIIHHLGYTFDEATMKWKTENYWDYKDPKGVEKIIASPVQEYSMPMEIRDYVKRIR